MIFSYHYPYQSINLPIGGPMAPAASTFGAKDEITIPSLFRENIQCT